MPQSSSRPTARPRTPTWIEDAYSRAGRSLAAGTAYFVALMGAGWTLGRVGGIVARSGLDPWLAVLIAAVPLLLVVAFASAWAIRLCQVRDHAGDRLLVGSVAVTLAIAAEFVGGELTRGWGLYEMLANLTSWPGSVFIVLLIVALLTPLLEPLGRRKPA